MSCFAMLIINVYTFQNTVHLEFKNCIGYLNGNYGRVKKLTKYNH